MSRLSLPSPEDRLAAARRVMFVTAHPDDECMFFAPAITRLARRVRGDPSRASLPSRGAVDSDNNCSSDGVYLVCLSSGDFEGLGHVRMQELLESAGVLGVPRERVAVVDMPDEFPDHPTKLWDIERLVQVIERFMDVWAIDALVSFDDYGVSGHANHQAVSRAVQSIGQRHRQQRRPRGSSVGGGSEARPSLQVFLLESKPVWRKYSGLLDVLLSLHWFHRPESQVHIVSRPEEIFAGWDAMHEHESQFVWFRKLYILFSSYMVINTLSVFDGRGDDGGDKKRR